MDVLKNCLIRMVFICYWIIIRFLRKCLHPCFHRQSSPISGSGRSHNVDSPALPPERMSSQVFGSSQTHFSTEEDSMSLAKRKGPLPPLPLHARADMKLHQSGSVHMLSWVPPPPAYTAPNAPLSSAALKKSASFAPVSSIIFTFSMWLIWYFNLNRYECDDIIWMSFLQVKDSSLTAVKRFQSFHVNGNSSHYVHTWTYPNC